VKSKEIEWSKGRLKDLIKREITSMFSSVLDFAEVAVDGKERFNVLRSKVLREGNDAIRSLCSELDKNYEVNYVGLGEDVIKVVKRPVKDKDGGK
jgi:hypothetical protein